MALSRKVLGALMLLFSASYAANWLHNPLRIRVNNELVSNVFHKRDQDLLKLVSDLDLGTFALGDHASIKGLQVSFEPASGFVEDFDYKLSLDQSKFLGIQSDNIKIRGTGQLVHAGQEEPEDFTIEGPLSNFKISFQVRADKDQKIDFEGIDVTLNNDEIKIESKSPVFAEHGHAAQLKQWIQKRLVEELHNIRQEALGGKEQIVKNLPALSLAPVIGLYYASFMAERIEFADSYIEYEFSPVSMKLIPEKKLYNEFIKAIKTEFAPNEESEDPSALQLIVDENLINSVIGMFLKLDTTYSLRELLALDPRLIVMRQLLTTTTIGMAIPQFKEQFGDNKPIDIVFDPSHSFMVEGLGSVSPTSVTIDANGNFNVGANLGAQIIIDPKGESSLGRAIYVQFQLKGKMFVADQHQDNRTLVILPKSLSMPVFKVKTPDGEEQFMEQMLVQSMIGFQLDNLKKQFKPAIIPLKKFNNPRELQCLGFNLTNVNVKINKHFLQVNGNYMKLDPEQIDAAFCEKFEGAVANSPHKVFEKIASNPFFDHPMIGKLFGGDKLQAAKAPKKEIAQEITKDEF